MPQSSCLCGANVISWDAPSAFNFRCHCLDERKLRVQPSPSMFSFLLMRPKSYLASFQPGAKLSKAGTRYSTTHALNAAASCTALVRDIRGRL
jgi:hypothetical protein